MININLPLWKVIFEQIDGEEIPHDAFKDTFFIDKINNDGNLIYFVTNLETDSIITYSRSSFEEYISSNSFIETDCFTSNAEIFSELQNKGANTFIISYTDYSEYLEKNMDKICLPQT